MRQIQKTYDLYKFNELDEKTQDKVLTKMYDINVDHEWYDSTYEDASNIGLEIDGFNLDRGVSVEGQLSIDIADVISKILAEHGKECATYILAETTKKTLDTLDSNIKAALAKDTDPYDLEGEREELEEEFEKDLLNEYGTILYKEYEHLTSSEAIKETILLNEYEFTKEGLLFGV